MIPNWYIEYEPSNGNNYYTSPVLKIAFEDDRGYMWEKVFVEPACNIEEDKASLDASAIL